MLVMGCIISNLVYIIWSSITLLTRSSLILMLSVADISLSVCSILLHILHLDSEIVFLLSCCVRKVSFSFSKYFTAKPDFSSSETKPLKSNVSSNKNEPFSNSLYFPLVSSVGVMLHLLTEMVRLIKIQKQEKCINIETEAPHSTLLKKMFSTSTLAAVLSLFICMTITKNLNFCSRFSGEHLKCRMENYPEEGEENFTKKLLQKLLQFVVNPVYFPLTITAVIPIMIFLARSQTLFKQQDNVFSKKISWTLFLVIYSLFICDLFIFGETEIFSGEYFVLPEPQHWRRSVGSIIRNIVIICIAHL